jgi:hypothetical protein
MPRVKQGVTKEGRDERDDVPFLPRICGACLAAFDCALYFRSLASRYADHEMPFTCSL